MFIWFQSLQTEPLCVLLAVGHRKGEQILGGQKLTKLGAWRSFQDLSRLGKERVQRGFLICIKLTQIANGKTGSRSCACLLIPYLFSFHNMRRGQKGKGRETTLRVYSSIDQHFFSLLFTVFTLMFLAVVTTWRLCWYVSFCLGVVWRMEKQARGIDVDEQRILEVSCSLHSYNRVDGEKQWDCEHPNLPAQSGGFSRVWKTEGHPCRRDEVEGKNGIMVFSWTCVWILTRGQYQLKCCEGYKGIRYCKRYRGFC